MRYPALKNAIGAKTDGVGITFHLQRFIEARDGEGGIGPEKPHQPSIRISCNDRLQNALPVVRAVHISGTQGATLQMAELIEDEQRMVAHAAKVTVPSGALLRAMGRAH